MADNKRFCLVCRKNLSEVSGENNKRVCTGCGLVYEGENAGSATKLGVISREPIVYYPKSGKLGK